jgi:hypothetical protein
MNGATALLPPKTINNPRRSRTMMIGASQNFFRSFIKSHKSFKKSIVHTLGLNKNVGLFWAGNVILI